MVVTIELSVSPPIFLHAPSHNTRTGNCQLNPLKPTAASLAIISYISCKATFCSQLQIQTRLKTLPSVLSFFRVVQLYFQHAGWLHTLHFCCPFRHPSLLSPGGSPNPALTWLCLLFYTAANSNMSPPLHGTALLFLNCRVERTQDPQLLNSLQLIVLPRFPATFTVWPH